LFLALQAHFVDPTGAAEDALDLLAFVIHTFRSNEDEVVKLHAPLLAFASIDLVRQSDPEKRGSDTVLALNIAHALLKETSRKFFTTVEREDATATDDGCGLLIASEFYSAADNKSAKIPSSGFAQRVLRNGIQSLLDFVQKGLSIEQSIDSEVLASAFNAISFLAEQLPGDQPILLNWQSEIWLSAFAKSVRQQSQLLPFEVVETAIQALLAISSAPIEPGLVLDKRTTLAMLIDLVLGYLRADQSAFHVQAVALIWALEEASTHRHVEAIICQRMTASDRDTRESAYEAFGNLWRFTDDALLPALRLPLPMRLMLDALRSNDLATRRAGEAWMRTSVQSYLKYVSPRRA
jgi:hypothetical protein